MNQAKPVGGTGRGEPIQDSVLIREAMQGLQQQGVEFPIKVEGAQTLPYAARVQHIDLQKGLLHLKLIRPLPHELPEGAAFGMVFAVGEQRFEAPNLLYRGRESYLLYRFTIPPLMTACDRRRFKRFPFRPREKAYVVAQDASVPGYGLSGPLVNLSQDGLAFRVDRVMRLDDHLRVTPGLGFFDRGKSFPMVKLRDLPNVPVFDARGILIYAEERGGEIVAGIRFGALKEAELQDLQLVLHLRDKLQRAPASAGAAPPRDPGPKSPSEAANGPAARMSPAGSQTPDALRRLTRRCTRIILAMDPGPDREQVRQTLCGGGFYRLETADTLAQALGDFRADRHASAPLLVLEARLTEALPLADIQAFREEFGASRDLTVALITRGGTPPPSEDPLIRPLPWPSAGDLSWLPQLDDLAGLD
jgi:hypothetical protein